MAALSTCVYCRNRLREACSWRWLYRSEQATGRTAIRATGSSGSPCDPRQPARAECRRPAAIEAPVLASGARICAQASGLYVQPASNRYYSTPNSCAMHRGTICAAEAAAALAGCHCFPPPRSHVQLEQAVVAVVVRLEAVVGHAAQEAGKDAAGGGGGGGGGGHFKMLPNWHGGLACGRAAALPPH